jgi:hypothetical protein
MKYSIVKNFDLKLVEFTKVGNPLLMGTPLGILSIFDTSDKPFIGKFDQMRFTLTNNSIFQSSCYLVTGTYEQANNHESIVKFEIQPIQYYKYFVALIFFLGLLAVNGFFYFTSSENFKFILTINGLIILLGILELRSQNRRRKHLMKLFVESFNINCQ